MFNPPERNEKLLLELAITHRFIFLCGIAVGGCYWHSKLLLLSRKIGALVLKCSVGENNVLQTTLWWWRKITSGRSDTQGCYVCALGSVRSKTLNWSNNLSIASFIYAPLLVVRVNCTKKKSNGTVKVSYSETVNMYLCYVNILGLTNKWFHGVYCIA